MNFLSRISKLTGRRNKSARHVRRRSGGSWTAAESMEQRTLLTAQALPVLMVVADQQDFYYQEYGDTRHSLERAGVEVHVAATTLNPSVPHAGTGQGPDGGIVQPDLTLADVNVENYSAIVFVGGWGSSMYQYAFPGDYSNNHYDGDLATKQIVNELINDFVDQEKHVAGICHGVTVLAWARVDGVSPLEGKQVSVPYIGSPAVLYQGAWYGNYQLGQYEQVAANGGIANLVSGQYGNTSTATDDVVVDGRIITAENYDSAAVFGQIVAQEVLAAAEADEPLVNRAPVINDVFWQLPENSSVGTVAGVAAASDPDVGQILTWSIVSGNVSNAFAIDSATGQVTINNAAAIDFETTPVFQLLVQVADDGTPSMADTAVLTIRLQDVNENPPASVRAVGKDLMVQGSQASDTIYIWNGQSDTQVFVWMNGVKYGSWNLPDGGRTIVYGGDGNDRIFGTSARSPLTIFGEAGHDQITGGSGDDFLSGGEGYDRIQGFLGNDVLIGGDDNDFMDGMEGNDILIGGAGADYLKGGSGSDLIIGGMTTFDDDSVMLNAVRGVWNGGGSVAERYQQLMSGSGDQVRPALRSLILEDHSRDTVCTGEDADLLFAGVGDAVYGDQEDLFDLL